MKRIWIALIFMAFVITFCITEHFAVSATADRVSGVLQSSAEKVNSSELTESYTTIKKEWDKSSILFKSLLIHNDFAEIEVLINQLKKFALDDDKKAFKDCCLEASARLECIKENENPSFENIF